MPEPRSTNPARNPLSQLASSVIHGSPEPRGGIMASPNRSRGLLAVVIGCVLLLVSACSGVVASPNGEGKATLRLASMFLPTSLDPVRGIDAVFSFVETLTRVDAAGNALPFLLAEDPVQVRDGVWKLTLQPGITFQNGKEVDA